MRPVGVVFDLDGTLVDSRLDLAAAVNATRERLALPALPVAAVAAMVGEGARTLLRRALPEGVAGEAFEAALALFLDLYYDRCLDATRAYAGIAQVLAELSPRLPLAVLTNKPERHSRRILEGLGLAAHFRQLIGGDTLAVRKPDPAGLHRIAAGFGTSAPRLLLVGDSPIDAETARAAGAALALVSWGFGSPEQLAGLDGWHLDAPADLLVRLRS
jgi:phosphoglycolate phosphatase